METVTILLVEDEAFLLMDFQDTLNEAGFNVLAETNGKKAIERLRAARQSILGVITDVRLGSSPDGWEVARIAREIDPQMAVVYISGHGAPEWASRGVPGSIMIEKPFANAQLVTAISQLLNDRSTGAGTTQ